MAAVSSLTLSRTIFRERKFSDLDPIYSDFLGSILMMGALISPPTGHISNRLKREQLMILSTLGITMSFFLIPSLHVEALAPIILLLGFCLTDWNDRRKKYRLELWSSEHALKQWNIWRPFGHKSQNEFSLW